jgi:hypothetical protein
MSVSCGSRMDMSCEEFQDMVDGYALSVLDPSELLACAQHLAQPGPHAGCGDIVAGVQGVAAHLVDVLRPMPPSALVWDGILAGLSTDAERLRLERVEHQRAEPATHQGQA